MAQIFVSHSSRDQELVDVLARAFAVTKVKAVYEEFEAISSGSATAPRILQHISESNAVFVVIGRNVETQKHTRDWVAFEGGAAAGLAAQRNKDIWVIESIADLDSLSVVIPRLRHYVCLDHTDARWQAYLSEVIRSYDDSHVLKAVATGGLVGAASDSVGGILAGAGAGLFLAALTSPARPVGISIRCPQCQSIYNVHLADPQRMRCPVCNIRLLLVQVPAHG